MPKLPKGEVAAKSGRYKDKRREGFENGEYVHKLHMKFSDRNRSNCKGYQVRVLALGDGYSKWFGINEYGSWAETKKAAELYREFAFSQLPNLFPSKDTFIKWLMRRA